MSTVQSSSYPSATVRSHTGSTRSCSVCQTIANAFLAENVFPRSRLSVGTWQGFLERKQCVCCQLIVSYLEKCRPHETKFEPSCRLELTKMSDCFWLSSDLQVRPHSKEPWEVNHPIIKLIPKRIAGQKHPGYVSVDPAQIDIAKLGIWPESCDRNHQGFCHNLPQWQINPPASSLILIDVDDYCLVHISKQMTHRYVALSYVWGRISGTIELKRKNFRQLFLKNSLKLPSHLSCIPKTILDAITLTGAMGLRYLWVDRLCIIQDEPTHLTEQLQQMASIYANSYFTIIAADGYDANYGLPGVDSDSSPRSYEEILFEFTANFKMIQKPETESPDEAFWHTRAWTFQERAVSPRNLVFTHNTVYWQCRIAIWFENISAEPDEIASVEVPLSREISLIGHPSYALKVKPWPDIEQYFTLVSGYNNRDLSFESDALRAFSAVTTAMSKSFPGGFHLGLPVFLFDVGMLWSRCGPSKRRGSFPSWSWLGWAGHVNLDFGYQDAWKPGFEYPKSEVEIKPLVDWYAIHRDGGSRHLIDNSYHLHKADILGPDFSPPDGWTRNWNEERGAEAVQHESLPNYSFKYPFPVFPVVTEDKAHLFSSYLEFKANSCTLSLGASYDAITFEHETSMDVDLQDSRGCWVGVVESWYMRGNEYKCGTPCELIAISEGSAKRIHRNRYEGPSVQQPFHEMDRVPVIEKLKKYFFYNVLWIEWIGGIAYRQAAGRVLKEAWDRQSLIGVSVILG